MSDECYILNEENCEYTSVLKNDEKNINNITLHFKDDQDEDVRVSWTYEESIALINSVESHYEMLHHPKKKKYVWSNVSNDLESINIMRSSKQCADKWKNLIRSYKVCKDLKKKSERAPSRFMYFERMHSFLGYNLNNSSSNTTAIGAEIVNENICTDNLPVVEVLLTESEVPTTSTLQKPGMKRKLLKRKNIGISLTERKLKIEEKKLTEKIEENRRRERRWNEKLSVMKRKLDLQERKIIAFEKYVALQEQRAS